MMRAQVKQQLIDIFYAGIEAVKTHRIIDNNVTVVGNILQIKNSTFALGKNVYLVGFGKAVLGMAIAMEKLLENHLTKGIISVPRGSISKIGNNINGTFPNITGVVSYRENSLNNQPDNDTLLTTHDIIDMIETLGQKDTLIVLISGGGSALLSMPRPLVSSEIKLDLCKKLFNSGADIKEVNLIRQKLSMVKAGGLARMAYPAPVFGLILSDIIEDPIELIASGPTVYSPKSNKKVIEILEKYKLFDEIDEGLKNILISNEILDEKILLDDQHNFRHVHNFVIGNNSLAIEASRIECLRQGLHPIVLFNNIHGLVTQVSSVYVKICYLFCQVWNKSMSEGDLIKALSAAPELELLNKRANEIYNVLQLTEQQGLVLIAGGEPSIVVTGSGKGGRNQQLALTFSLDWLKVIQDNPALNTYEVVFLSAGTDGQDGPTDAAGAFGYPEINAEVLDLQQQIQHKYESASEDTKKVMKDEFEKIIPENVLNNNDTYTFYSQYREGEDLIQTGFTGTNVMDLHLLYIKKRGSKEAYTKRHLHQLNA